jgi:hypothetical protein
MNDGSASTDTILTKDDGENEDVVSTDAAAPHLVNSGESHKGRDEVKEYDNGRYNRGKFGSFSTKWGGGSAGNNWGGNTGVWRQQWGGGNSGSSSNKWGGGSWNQKQSGGHENHGNEVGNVMGSQWGGQGSTDGQSGCIAEDGESNYDKFLFRRKTVTEITRHEKR